LRNQLDESVLETTGRPVFFETRTIEGDFDADLIL